MSLVFDQTEARKADSQGGSIRDAGVYRGTITRAEKLLSKNNVEGIGISFKTDDGLTANYLDLYTVKPDGEKLRGFGFAQAILCCTRTREASEGAITFERYDKDAGGMVKASANGYPELMGKRIGLLLQKELSTNIKTGKDVERVNIYGVFEADTGFTSSEILDKATKSEQLNKLVDALERNPVRDNRTGGAIRGNSPQTGSAPDAFEDDLPF